MSGSDISKLVNIIKRLESSIRKQSKELREARHILNRLRSASANTSRAASVIATPSVANYVRTHHSTPRNIVFDDSSFEENEVISATPVASKENSCLCAKKSSNEG